MKLQVGRYEVEYFLAKAKELQPGFADLWGLRKSLRDAAFLRLPILCADLFWEIGSDSWICLTEGDLSGEGCQSRNNLIFWVVATQIFFIFTPKIGEDEPILTSIFFRWVGSTTNQFLNVVFWVGRMIMLMLISILGDEVVVRCLSDSTAIKSV